MHSSEEQRSKRKKGVNTERTSLWEQAKVIDGFVCIVFLNQEYYQAMERHLRQL